MVTSLLKYDRIRTTDAKAKELKRWADNLITLAKRGDLHARRQALAIVREKEVVHKLFGEAEERFGAIAGGYTRIVRMAPRPGDAAPVSLVELVSPAIDKNKKDKKKKTAAREKKLAASAPAAAEEQKSSMQKDPPQRTALESKDAGPADSSVSAPSPESESKEGEAKSSG